MTSLSESIDCTLNSHHDLPDGRKNAHTAAEQKRRNAIKLGIDQLQELIPGLQSVDVDDNKFVSKQSKAQILSKSIEYVSYLKKDHEKKKKEIAEMEKKLAALQIMKGSYEKMVDDGEKTEKAEISNEIKFRVFQTIMATLWEPFDRHVSLNDFQGLSTTIIPWLEQFCKPELLKNAVVKAVRLILG